MEAKSGYLIGSLIIGIPYLIIFGLRRDLRKEMLFGSFTLLPWAFTAPLFIPEYWNPPYMFGYILPFRFGIEDLLFIFFVGGISAVIFEFIENKREIKLKKSKSAKIIYIIPYLLTILLFAGLEYIFPDKAIYNLIAAGLISGAYMIYTRRDLLVQSLSSGLFFALLYFLLFSFFNLLYPNYVTEIYNSKNLLGITVLQVPIEEILFAFATGAGWSVFYEFFLKYRTT